MNITDLGFNFDIKIDFDGDFDGGYYDLYLKFHSCTQHDLGITETTICLRQDDIEAIYEGALKLANALKKHIREGY